MSLPKSQSWRFHEITFLLRSGMAIALHLMWCSSFAALNHRSKKAKAMEIPFISFLTHPNHLPFTIAILIAVTLALIELASLLTGINMGGAIDEALGDSRWFGHHCGESLVDGSNSPSLLSTAADWIHFGRIPSLVLLLAFFTAFGFFGLLAHALGKDAFSYELPLGLTALAAFAFAIGAIRVFGLAWRRFLPDVETTAVSQDDLLGRIATITIGIARQGFPAQASVRDRFGRKHFVLVEPECAHTSLSAGKSVILKARRNGIFRCLHAEWEEVPNLEEPM